MRINIDNKKETSVIYVSVFIYACALMFSIFFVQHVETFIVYINSEYIGVSKILFWSVLLGAATASNHLVVSLLSGKMLIKGQLTSAKFKRKVDFILPNAGDYNYIKIIFGEADLRFLRQYLSSIENRFSRRIIQWKISQLIRR
mgnify:CR=1 FL=1